MASSTRIWALFVLSLSLFLACHGQNDVNDDSLRSLGYEVVSAVHARPGSTQDEEITVVALEDSNSKNAEGLGSTDAPIATDAASEPPVVRKQAPCLGCPTQLDITIPENLKALRQLLEEPLIAMDSKSEFKYSAPNILSATKQVESSIRYVITFEVLRTWCSANDPPKSREECLLQPEESRICLVEIIDENGARYVAYNNCTVAVENEMPSKDWDSHESAYHGSIPLNDGELNSANIKMSDFIQNYEEKMDDLEESMSANSQENDGPQEVEDIRVRRSVNYGGLKDVEDSEQDLISQFADLAVKTLDEVDPDNTKRIVLGVTEAKKQIVNGILYHLVIQVGTSTCLENEGTKSDSNCVENQLYPEKICRVQIHRSWADDSPLNAKVVKSECADVWPDDFAHEPSASSRKRRSTEENNWPSTDGWKEYELDDRSQGDCFDKVLLSFQSILDVKDVKKVATIREAHTRVNKESLQPEMVVTIVLTDPILLKLFGDTRPMVISSRVVCTQRLKRSPGVPGGLSEANVKDPYVMEITKFGMSEIQKSVNSPYQHSLVRIIEARSQVVAGTLYHFKVEIAPTSCLKTDQQSKDCTPSSNSEQLMICTFKVWDQPWTQLRQIQDLICSSSRSKREVTEVEKVEKEKFVLGGLSTQDVEDPYVKELASFALTEIDKGLNSPYQQKVIRVVEAKSQVVSGTLMHLKLELVTTNCLKSEKIASDNCVYDADKETTMCSLKIWDRVWLKKRLLQDLQCGRTRSKREISHFLKVDTKDPYIIESANYALQEIDRQTNSPYRHKLVHLNSALVEHTTLTKVKMFLHVGYSTCRKSSKSAECSLQKDSGMKTCIVELKQRPTVQMRELVSLNCSPLESGSHLVPHNSMPLYGHDEDLAAASFRDFMHTFNKTYSSDSELHKRFQIFKENLKVIDSLQRGEQGTAVYGATIFADLSPKEFKEKYMGLRRDLHQENAVPMPMARIPKMKLPTSFDWRDHNAVTPVKNQGACGSCWAFAVTGNLEGQYAIKHGNLLSFSEQELVDCDTLDDGCKGGLPENAYHALEQLGGIETESDYPYEGDDEQCHFNRSEVKVQVKSSVNVTTNEVEMAQWLVKNGPIAIGINANAMQFYMGGVSHPFKFLCSPGNLDHGVLIVGYGVHTTSIRHKVLPYWLIKNSWGTFWGEKGYYRVYRGDGTCGVNQMASSAVIA